MEWAWRTVLLIASLCNLSAAPENYDPLAYRTGFAAVQTLGRDIYRSLSAPQKQFVSPEAISLETSARPSIRPLYQEDGAEVIRGVWISRGFIDLINQLAHAKAIDRLHKGYLRRYMELIEKGGDHVPPLPDKDTPEFWTDDVLNEQRSNFNSIAGALVGINLAHHYLGHYQKYGRLLENSGGNPVPINDLLTRREWEESYLWGIQNAMNAGCLIEGALPFFESFSKMKHRPSWAAFFLPERFDFAHMRKDMVKLQRQFLRD